MSRAAGTLGLVLALALCAGAARAELAVSRHAFARDVVAREPVGVARVFPADVGEIAFFTQVLGARGTTEIVHAWIYDGREVARVALPVEGPSWRTWSRKRIPAAYVGDWTVEVRDAGGTVLLTDTCRVE